MNENKVIDLISFLFVVIICTIIFGNLGTLIFIKKIRLFSIDSPLVFAFLVGIVLLICLVITIVKERPKTGGKRIESDVNSNEDKYGEYKTVICFVVGLFIYVQLLKVLHFRLGTTVYMLIAMFLLNTSNYKRINKLVKAVAATLVTVPLLYFVFNGIFNVMLP